ncbi:response regulator [Mucilaginibacter hurinus]|uniref:Response regulator n=1 Tax=Mucilaginibacter hurinus TaxID=2201324 RepID=A0A367GNT4_9SPHI|nr:response regulator [Mucilaginibacter hurinus]RCH55119.1 response regulator [Mucilaginibacter hurinus]
MAAALSNKVLLVDDNIFFLNILVQEFSRTGLECTMAESAKEAIEILKTEIPDIILSDLEMPEMNGIEFRKYLIEHKNLRDIPFVFLTYLADRELITEGLDLQAIDYIVKDTPIEVISSKLNNILSAVNTQRERSSLEIRNAAKSLNIKSIPTKIPYVKGFEIDFWHQPYHDIPGGDFIDLIPVNDRYTFVALGDIMGKKWMAWYFTFGFLSYVRSAVRFATLNGDFSTASIVQKVNSIICLDDVLQDILSSLSLLLIDSETQTITYSGAGDLPLLHYEADAKKLNIVKSEGLLLGLFAEADYDEKRIVLKDDDQLFIFTDGMIDFAGENGKQSDYNLFADKLLSYLKDSTADFRLMKKNLLSVDTDKQVDDCSIININKRYI